MPDNMRKKLIELLKDGGVRDFPFNAALADHLIANGVTVQKWFSVTEPPKATGHYLVNIHQEDDERGEMCDFVLDAWYEVNGLLFAPKEIGWTLLNEWYDLTAQMRPFITHWMPLPESPKEVEDA